MNVDRVGQQVYQDSYLAYIPQQYVGGDMSESQSGVLAELVDIGLNSVRAMQEGVEEEYANHLRGKDFEEVITTYAGLVHCAYYMEELFKDLPVNGVLGSIGEVIKHTNFLNESSVYKGVAKTLGDLHKRSGLVEAVDRDFGGAREASMYIPRFVTPALPSEWAYLFIAAWQNGCRNPMKAVVDEVVDIETSDGKYPRFPTFQEIREGVSEEEWVEISDENTSLYWALTQATLAVSDLYNEANRQYRIMRDYVRDNNPVLWEDLQRGQEIESGGMCESAFCSSAYTQGGYLHGMAKDNSFDVVKAMETESDVIDVGGFKKQVPLLAALILDQEIATVDKLYEAYTSRLEE